MQRCTISYHFPNNLFLLAGCHRSFSLQFVMQPYARSILKPAFEEGTKSKRNNKRTVKYMNSVWIYNLSPFAYITSRYTPPSRLLPTEPIKDYHHHIPHMLLSFLFFNFILRWVVNIGIHILTVILPIKWTWKGQVKVCWPPFTARRRKLTISALFTFWMQQFFYLISWFMSMNWQAFSGHTSGQSEHY